MEFPLISLNPVIADIRAELKRMNQSGEIQDEDCLNFIVECIREIGGTGDYGKEPAVLFVENHVVDLPKNLYLIEEVWLCHPQNHPAARIELNLSFNNNGIYYIPSRLVFPGDAFTGSKFCRGYEQYPNLNLEDVSYIIRHPKQLRCSLSKCVLGINYLILPGDHSQGYMMQDEINSIKAVKAFTTMMLLREKWILGEIPNYVYASIKQDYSIALDQAQAIMKFEDPANDKAKGYRQDHRYDNFRLR